MAKNFMGKKVNVFLLLMILLVLIGLSGSTVYYQYVTKNKNTEISNLDKNLQVCNQNLDNNVTALKKAERTLNTTTSDIRKYDVLYEQKAGELEEKADELSSAKADVTRLTIQKEVYKKQIDQAYAQIITLNESVGDLSAQVTSLTNQIDDQNEQISCLYNTDDGEEISCL